MTKVQIVMPAINLWKKYTLPAIESTETAMVYAKNHSIDSRLLLIDNASTDETKVEASKRVSDTFCHKRNEDRWGFQKSVNYGVNDAFERGYDFVLVCNNDILLHPQSIWRLTERFQNEGGDIGMMSCMDVRGETDSFLFPSMNPSEKEEVEEAPHPNFSAFMLNRNTWEEVGEMDELFAPAYFEDNDYHYRMGLAGLGAIVFPPALFYHFGSGTQNEANESGQPIVPGPLFENNRSFYAKKWGGVPGAETYTHPYDDQSKSIKNTTQHPDL